MSSPDCLKFFKHKSSLEKHAWVHSKEKPYTCGALGCNFSFSQVSIYDLRLQICIDTWRFTPDHLNIFAQIVQSDLEINRILWSISLFIFLSVKGRVICVFIVKRISVTRVTWQLTLKSKSMMGFICLLNVHKNQLIKLHYKVSTIFGISH